MMTHNSFKYGIPRMIIGSMLLLSACATFRPPAPVKEARAVWLHRFEYCEYSSTNDQDSIRSYIKTAIQNASRANFNIVIFQVRGNGDAYYTPGLEPWGNLLTDSLGKDPGWDPLQFALDIAHREGLELHAWMNTFPAWRGTDPPPETQPRSPYLDHPEWVVADSSGIPMPLSDHYVSFSPGIPQVHDHIINVARDIVARYDVDGIHFDYIRYPEGSPDLGYSHDSISVARFNSSESNPMQLDWDDWQREQLNQFVVKMYNTLTSDRPELKISAAVIGSYIDGNWNSYHAVYQDPRRWMELGKVDFIAPMIYWPRNHPTQPFMVRSEEWADDFSLDRFVFPGIGSYRYNLKKRPYRWSEAQGQIDDLRSEQIGGMVFFDARSLKDHWEELANKRFRSPANLPAMTWKDSVPPEPPQEVSAQILEDIVTLRWSKAPSDSVIHRYNIYFSSTLPINPTKSRNLIMVIDGSATEWTVNWQGRKKRVYAAVSSLDKAWNESELSNPILIKVE